MTAEEDAIARYDAWNSAGRTDYNKQSESNPAITGANWDASQPRGFQSTNPVAGWDQSGPSTATRPTAQPFAQVASGAASAASNVVNGVTGAASAAGAGVNDIFLRTKALINDPRAVIDQVMKSLGIDPQGAGPMADYMRGQSTLMKPAYMLWQQNAGDTPDVTPEAYIDFAKNFLTSMGGNLSGGANSAIQSALGMGGKAQPANWTTMLNSMNMTDDERQALLDSLLSIGSMGSTSPFTKYKTGQAGDLLQQYHGAYGTNQPGGQGINPLFTDYIKNNLGKILGW